MLVRGSCLVAGIFVLLAVPHAQGQDTLRITFQTEPPSPAQAGHDCFWDPSDANLNDRYLVVVWLEEQSTGRYVRTVHRWGTTFVYNFESWAQAGDMQVDATTSATPQCFTRQFYQANFSGRITCGTAAGLQTAPVELDTGAVDISDLPDGTYAVHFELSGCELADEYASSSVTYAPIHEVPLTFSKGSANQTVSDPGGAPLINLNLDYVAGGGNRAPGVDAGVDQRIVPSGAPEEARAALDGWITDDNGVAAATWRMLSADPVGGQARFADASDAATEVTFSRSGIYVLELEADDGSNPPATDTVRVYVNTRFIAATDDAEVNSSSANRGLAMGYWADPSSFGHGAQGYSWGPDSGDRSRAYLRFDISSVAGPVERAVVRIPLGSEALDASNYHDFHLVPDGGDSWTDATLTWNNQPVGGGIVSSEPLIGSWRHSATAGVVTRFTFDADDLFPGGSHSNTIVSLFVRPRGDYGFGMAFHENLINPELVVVEEWDEPVVGPAASLSLASSQEVEGDVASVQATVTASPNPGGDLVLDLSSDDATVTVPSTVTITGGNAQATFDVTIVDDAVDTGNRTAIISASDGGGTYASDTAVLTVIEDDTALPQVSWQAAAQTVSEGDILATLRATLSFAPTTQVTVPYTVGGTATSADHDLTDGTLTFEIDETEQLLVVTLTFDGVTEGDETVVVTLGTPTGAMVGLNPVHTLTITDPAVDDGATTDGGPADGGTTTSDGGPTGGDVGPRPGSNIVQGAGCACAGGGVGWWWLGLLVLRRRRR